MGVKLYKNIEIGDIGETPSIPFVGDDALPVAKKSLIDFGNLLGSPICYKQEQGGQLIQHIIPVFKTEYGQISTSSKTNLELHTETAFHPYKPSFVLLLCLRGDKNAVTTYANVEDIVEKLSPESIEMLNKPFFITRIDESFRSNGEADFELFTSVLRPHVNGGFSMTFDKHFMRGCTEEAQKALDELNTAVNESIKEIVLESGDLLVIDNETTVHGRRPFSAKYDGTDRWVLRLLVSNHHIPLSHKRGNTIITEFNNK